MESLQIFISNQKDLISFIQSDISKDEYLAELLNIQLADLVSNTALIEEKLTDSDIAEKVMKYLCGDYEYKLEEVCSPIFQCSLGMDVSSDQLRFWVLEAGDIYISYLQTSWESKIKVTKWLPVDFCMDCCNDFVQYLQTELENGKMCEKDYPEWFEDSSLTITWNFDFISHWQEYVKQLEKDVIRIWNGGNRP